MIITLVLQWHRILVYYLSIFMWLDVLLPFVTTMCSLVVLQVLLLIEMEMTGYVLMEVKI